MKSNVKSKNGPREPFLIAIAFGPPQGIHSKHPAYERIELGFQGAEPLARVQGRRKPLPHAAQAQAFEWEKWRAVAGERHTAAQAQENTSDYTLITPSSVTMQSSGTSNGSSGSAATSCAAKATPIVGLPMAPSSRS